MNIIYLLLPTALLLVVLMLAFFFFAARRGEFDDLETPAHRMLFDDSPVAKVMSAESELVKETKRNEKIVSENV